MISTLDSSRRQRTSIHPRGVLGRLAAVAVLFAALAGTVSAAADAPGARVRADAALPAHVQLPHDEAAHRAPTEWWYFNGHLTAVGPRGRLNHYGFQYVTFKFEDATSPPVYVANVAVTDLARHRFTYAARTDSYPRPDRRDAFAVHVAGWSMSGADGRNSLHAKLPGYAFDLRTISAGPATLHGGDGVIRFAPFGRSAYYSWTSLLVRGTLDDHGVPMRVRGISWMDHQWGPFDFSSGGGWDWFSIQLRDGRRYMLYFLRSPSGRIIETVGTRVTAAHRGVLLPADAFTEHATGTWISPATGIRYASGWDLRVPGGHLQVSPRLPDQELDVRAVQGVAYWEGDVRVRGTIHGQPVSGVGYTEINPTQADVPTTAHD